MGRRPNIRLIVAFYGLMFLAALGGSAANGAFEAEFWGSDEAAHYVTGLLAADYLRAPFHPPFAFASKFYEHYPKVAIGHWPPVFYLAQSLWIAAFGDSRTSLLCLMAALAAGAATLTWRLLAPELHWGAAAIGLLFLALFQSQVAASLVMAEMPLTCGMLAACIAYRRYLDTGAASAGLWFGIFAAAAIMTKPSGLALALVPPLALVAARRFALLRRWDFYAPAALVAVTCAPWYLATFDDTREGWHASYTADFLIEKSGSFNVTATIYLVGPLLFTLALAGWAALAALPALRRGARPTWAVVGALAIAVFVFHTFLAPVREQRHLLPMAPALLGLAGGAIFAVARHIHPVRPAPLAAALGALAAAVFFWRDFRPALKPPYGAEPAVEAVLAAADAGDRIFVSSPGAEGEGAVIAEVAMRDQRPNLRLVRASKTLALSTWSRQQYEQLLHSPEEVVDWMEAQKFDFVVVETGQPYKFTPPPHHPLTLEALRLQPKLFAPMSTPSEENALSEFQAYRVAPSAR